MGNAPTRRCAHTRSRALAALILLFPAWVAAQSQVPADAADWPSYNRDLASTRFSPLTQINRDNVAGLRRAWSYPLGRNTTTNTLTGGSEFTPLVVDGTLYVAGAEHVAALRADSGEELWRYDREEGTRPPSRRGMAYWPGDENSPARVIFTAGRRLIALTPAVGERDWRDMPVGYLGAPVVYENLVIVGSNSAPGSVRAFDVHTGDEAWVFRAVPGPGEVGHDTWENDSWRDHPNLLHWAFSLTVDADRGLVYAVFESPGPDDYYGGNRPGDNLFGNSVVALDAVTGTRKWHFQTVRHDIWDRDLPAAPSLLDVTVEGETVPMLALVGKAGYMYLLNRVTGEPVFGVDEVPVPQSDVPGEQSAPTQPIPRKPAPIAKVSFSSADVVTAQDTTEEHAAVCRDLLERSGGFHNAGPFTPYMYRPPGSRARTTIVFPGDIGGANWGGTAVDPTLGYVFVNTMDEGSIGWMEERPAEQRLGNLFVPYRRNSISGPLSRFWSHDTGPESPGNSVTGGERPWPCNKPPWGSLLAVDAATGDIAWRVPLGITEELPPAKQRTGRLNMGGPMTTAGGLVFIGASNDRRFRAFDSRTGEELWVTELPMSAHAVPITYLGRDGKQYVAIVAAGASAIDDRSPDDAQALIAFSLP
jgi:quinoprotein glucose dehydrogenase